MLFGDMFKRQRPRGLTWIPRHYDPDDDTQYDDMRRQSRIAFNSLRTPASKRRGLNAFALLALVLMIIAHETVYGIIKIFYSVNIMLLIASAIYAYSFIKGEGQKVNT